MHGDLSFHESCERFVLTSKSSLATTNQKQVAECNSNQTKSVRCAAAWKSNCPIDNHCVYSNLSEQVLQQNVRIRIKYWHFRLETKMQACHRNGLLGEWMNLFSNFLSNTNRIRTTTSTIIQRQSQTECGFRSLGAIQSQRALSSAGLCNLLMKSVNPSSCVFKILNNFFDVWRWRWHSKMWLQMLILKCKQSILKMWIQN